MSYLWQRLTRLHEGQGERYHGRVSQTPVIGMVHEASCASAQGKGFAHHEDLSTLIITLHREGVGIRGIMSCPHCEAYGTVNSVKAGLGYLTGTTDLKPMGLRI